MSKIQVILEKKNKLNLINLKVLNNNKLFFLFLSTRKKRS